MFPEFAGIIYMFWLSGIVHHESIPTGKTMNKEMHNAVLRCLRNAVRWKLPEKWRTNSRLLLHDNAPAQRPVLVKEFLAKKNMTTMQHLPYSQLQLIFTCSLECNQHWRDGVFVMLLTIMNAAEELKKTSQNGFQECFHHLHIRWTKCTLAQGDQFQGNVAYMIHYFVFLRNKVTPVSF